MDHKWWDVWTIVQYPLVCMAMIVSGAVSTYIIVAVREKLAPTPETFDGKPRRWGDVGVLEAKLSREHDFRVETQTELRRVQAELEEVRAELQRARNVFREPF